MRGWLAGADAVARALVQGLGTALTRFGAAAERAGPLDPDGGRPGGAPPEEDPRRR